MYQGTIIENSLADKSVLNRVQITRTWNSSKWILHDVLVSEEQFEALKNSLADGPWYMHFWIPGNDEVKVIYRDKIFTIMHSDKSTWKEAVEHGKRLGIPEEQLDFVIN